MPRLKIEHKDSPVGRTDVNRSWINLFGTDKCQKKWQALFNAKLVSWDGEKVTLSAGCDDKALKKLARKARRTKEKKYVTYEKRQAITDYFRKGNWTEVTAPGSEDRSWIHKGTTSETTCHGVPRKQTGKVGRSSDLSLADEMAKHVYSLDECLVTISWTLPAEASGHSRFYICLTRKINTSKIVQVMISPHHVPVEYRTAGDRWIPRRSIPFLDSFRMWQDTVNDKKLRALDNSHLCQNAFCFSILHICKEEAARNLGRNGCPGVPLCRHYPRCIASGPNAYS